MICKSPEQAELIYALTLAQEMLAEYHRYGEEMRKIGRGFHPNSVSKLGLTEDHANRIIVAALPH